MKKNRALEWLGVLALSGCMLEQEPELVMPQGAEPQAPREAPEAPLPAPVPETLQGIGAPIDGFPVSPQPPRLGEVTQQDRRPPAISGGTLAVAPNGLAVAADPDRDAIFLVDPTGPAVTMLQLPVGSEPGRVSIDDSGHAHVVLRGTGELARVDLSTKSLAARTPVCALPRGVAHQKSSGSLIVACASGELVWLQGTDHAELQRRFLERDLRDVVLTTDDQLYVSRYRSAELLHVDAEGGVLGRHVPPTEQRLSSNPLSDVLVDGGMTPFVETAVSMSATLAWRAIPGAHGDVITLHQRSQEEEVVPSSGGYGGGCETITHTAMTSFDGHGPGPVGMPLTDATVAVDAAISPDGAWVAVAAAGAYLQGLGTLLVYDAGQALGQTPNLDGSCGFATASGCDGGQATAVAFSLEGKLYVQLREPALLLIVQVGVDGVAIEASIDLDGRSVSDTGHDLFHGNVGSGLACASCHGEALDDGHVWNFKGFGPRRTQNIRGGLLGTAPFHWEGDMLDFKQLVDEVMTGRMGGFSVERRYADALASWIDAQPAFSLPAQEALADAVTRGKQLFDAKEVGCATCHSGAALTNNVSVDVGTGGAFQVPSLRGVAMRGPWMHDGCAQTLAQRFDAACGGGDKHGTTSKLRDADVQDLISYLETL